METAKQETTDNSRKLGFGLLVALGVGSMIGTGIFDSPRNLISTTNPQAAIIAWIIGGLGVMFLALTFQMLNNARPDLKGGIFTYAKEGFGELTGFNSAWGYWLSAWLGNVAFIAALLKAFNTLTGQVDAKTGDSTNPLLTFILASVFLWILHFVQTAGVKKASVANAVATVAKVVPLILVVIVGVAVFNSTIFNVPDWTSKLASTGDAATTFDQVSGAMSTILWCFIGVEAATVLSTRAKSQKIVGGATIVSTLITLALYMLVSLISMGVVDAKTLADSNIPLADVFAKTVVGGAGGVIVEVGIIVSMIGGLISWIMLAAEILSVAAKGATMPAWFQHENQNGCPTHALLVTDILTQLFLFSILLPSLKAAYDTMFSLSTSCIVIPYLFSAMYAIKVCAQDKRSAKDMIISILACVYSVYVLYAIGIEYLGLTLILYAIGIFVFVWSKKERKQQIAKSETVGMTVIAMLAVLMIVLLATGVISL